MLSKHILRYVFIFAPGFEKGFDLSSLYNIKSTLRSLFSNVTPATLEDDLVPIKKLHPPTSGSKIPVVIFYNGTFCPIHFGRINTFSLLST